jgi:hypothetical protein
MFEFGAIAGLGITSRMCGCAVCLPSGDPGDRSPPVVGAAAGLFFGNVNQVLVRLWARVSRVRALFGRGGLLTDRCRLTTGH